MLMSILLRLSEHFLHSALKVKMSQLLAKEHQMGCQLSHSNSSSHDECLLQTAVALPDR